MTPTLERKRNQQLEAQMQDAIVQHLELRAVPGLVFWHTPNGSQLGGARTKSGIPLAAIRMKRHGLRKGVSDLVFLRPDGMFFSLELKSKGQRPTDEQHLFMEEVNAANGFAAWTDSLDRALEILKAWELISMNKAPKKKMAGRYVPAFSWHDTIDVFVRKIVVEKPLLHICSGPVSDFGDVRVDRYVKPIPPGVIADWTNLPFTSNSFGAIFADPPWNLAYMQACAQFCKEAMRIAPVFYVMSPWLWVNSGSIREQIWIREFPGINNPILIVKYARTGKADMTGHTLSPDWQPSDSDMMYGLSLGLTSDAIRDAAENMRLWAEANANRQVARKANWSAAFKGWLRRVAQKRGTHARTHTDATISAFDTIINSTAGRGVQGGIESFDDATGSGQTGQEADWLFPPRPATRP